MTKSFRGTTLGASGTLRRLPRKWKKETSALERLAGFHQREEDISGVAPGLGPGAIGDFALGDVAADVVLGAVCVQRYFGPIEYA